MPEQTPEYLAELEHLKESGGLDKVAELIKGNTDVWIKRSSGEWQKGKAAGFGHGGLSVDVVWFDEERGEQVGKNVKTTDFLQWQEEATRE